MSPIAVAAPQAPHGWELYERALAAVGDHELSDDEVDAALLAVLDDLAARAPELDDYGRNARFVAELALRVHAGEGSDPALEEALQAIRDELSRSSAIWQLAYAHVASGRLEDAEAIARFGLELRTAEPTIEPRLWHLRAEVARMRGRWDLVQEFLDRMEASIPAHAVYEGDPAKAPLLAQNHQYRSRLLQARAQFLLGLGLLDQCGGLAREAIAEAEQSAEPTALVAARLLAFDRALMSGDAAEEAVELMRAGYADERLAQWSAKLRLSEGIAEIERSREAMSEGKDAAPTADRARAAIAGALAAGLAPAEELEAELGLGDLELFLGRPGAARAHLERARGLAADVDPSGGLSDESVRLAVLAWGLARATGVELERCRAELFGAYGRFLEQWRSTPRRPGGIGFLHVAWRAQVVSEVIDAELSMPGADDAQRAFARLLEAQAMGTQARERGLPRPSAGELRAELLGAKRGMLVLLPARDQAHLFVLDPQPSGAKAIEHYHLDLGREALRRNARSITAALRRGGEVDPHALHELHEDLLPSSVRTRVGGWSGAITVGFDLLCDLPFGLLGAESGSPYGARLALTSLPSAALGIELARRGRRLAPAGKDLVLVVASDPPQELALQPFSFGAGERKRLLAPFDEQSVTLLEGAASARGGLLQQRDLLRGARVLHFLTHGTTLPGREYSSALVLSGSAAEGERMLCAEDVARFELGGLVVLSACGSGRGPARTGDDRLVHLGGAFLDAGARCVVLARFPVEYQTTLALMERFHARLAAGDAPAEALRAARAQGSSSETLATFPQAAFEVLGLGFEPIFPR